ncbi:MAG: DUF1830 domain-containing protein [Cyanobacteria bacterium J06634_6]
MTTNIMKPQISTTLFSNASGTITCRYINETARIQIIRMLDVATGAFERTIFPGGQLMFDIQPSALLEVSTCELATAIVRDRIPCMQLRYAESLDKSTISSPTPSSDACLTSLAASCR